MIKSIIWDMDGTLVNSGTMISNTINYVRENIGLERLDKKLILEQVNNPDINSSEYFYGTTYFTDKQTKLFGEYYNENCVKEVELYEGIEYILNKYSDKLTMHIATNAHDNFAHKILEHLNIKDHFINIIGSNNVKKPKPDPEMIHKVINDCKYDYNNYLVIGDSHKDIQAASNAGINSILVNWGFSDHLDNDIDSITKLEEEILKHIT